MERDGDGKQNRCQGEDMAESERERERVREREREKEREKIINI